MSHIYFLKYTISFSVVLLLVSSNFIYVNNEVLSETNSDKIFLFTETDKGFTKEHKMLSGLYPTIQRWRPVTINPEIYNNIISYNTSIVLNLFEDRSFTAIINDEYINIMDTRTITGIIHEPKGSFCMTTTNKSSYITIQVPSSDQLYIIQNSSQLNQYYLMEFQLTNYPKIEDADLLNMPNDATNIFCNSDEVRGQTTIDIMIIYTPAAKNWADTYSGGIENIISQAFNKCQSTLSNSMTNTTFNLVHTAEINYTESGSSTTDITRLTNTNDGYMDEVHSWRDIYGADLVQIFEYVNDVGGLAWQLTNPNGSPSYGFSLVRVQQASTGYSSIHEFGHNMGCDHHKQQTSHPGPGLFTYSAGWRWTGNSNSKYCTVMTYESGQYFADGQNHNRVAHFSNPQIYYEGYSTGDINDADNARSIREIKQVIAAYRQSPSQIDINQSVYDHGFPIRHTIYGDWGGAQSFVPNTSTLTHIELYLRKFGTPEFDLIIDLRQQSIDGPLIDSKTFSPSEIPNGWTWFPIDFNDHAVSQNTEYYIVCHPVPAGTTNNYGYEWGYAYGNQYDNGVFWFTRDSGLLWRDLPSMYEYTFRTFGYSSLLT